MKKLIIAATLMVIASGLTACGNHHADKAETNKIVKKKGKYFCPMNPDVISDKPGVCRKCGMELVERDTTGDK